MNDPNIGELFLDHGYHRRFGSYLNLGLIVEKIFDSIQKEFVYRVIWLYQTNENMAFRDDQRFYLYQIELGRKAVLYYKQKGSQ